MDHADKLTPELRIMEISGRPRERGRQYGEQARRQIDASVQWYAELFERDHEISWSELAEHAMAWMGPVEQFDADLAEEVRGIADGAGREVGEIVALNARGEMVYGDYAPPADGCTSYALMPTAAADGHLYAGQNWDWRLPAQDTWVVLRVVQPPKPTLVMVVEAGQVGRHGVSSAGIGVFSNGLTGFCTPEPRVPQPFIRRRVLDQSGPSEALETLIQAPQQIASNVLLVHRDDFAIDLETTPERRGWMYPEDGVLAHANHYEVFSWAHDGDEYKPLGADTLYRVDRIRRHLDGLRGLETQAEIVTGINDGLADHFGFPDAVCAHAREEVDPLLRWQTLTSSVVDLTTGEWWLTPGNPCRYAQQKLPFNLYDSEA